MQALRKLVVLDAVTRESQVNHKMNVRAKEEGAETQANNFITHHETGRKNEKLTTFCSREKFLQSFVRKVAQSPIRFFTPEPPETISLSALSASVSSSASSEAASPSSAFMLLFCKTKKTTHEIRW